MAEYTTVELGARSHDHLVWLAGVEAGREAVHLCETYEESASRSPYLVDGQDPTHLMLERIAEVEKGYA